MPSLVHIADLIDIALVAVLIYAMLAIVRQTHTQLIAAGILVLAAVYLIALTAGLRLTAFLFQIFFTAIVVALIVLFREEVRTFFERFAAWLFTRRSNSAAASPHAAVVDTLVSTAVDLAHARVGALIVLQGVTDIQRHAHGGITLDGQISEPLLKSIFDPHSVGHDGALIIAGNRVARFGCHLPLSTDDAQLDERGTRHAAALGLAECTDAMCLIVSEERGSISLAHHSELKQITDTNKLHRLITDFFKEVHPTQRPPLRRVIFTSDVRLKLASILVAVALWFFFVQQSAVAYRSYTVPVQYTGLDQGLSVESVDPPRVRVVVSAPRRKFYFKAADDFPLTVRLFEQAAGVNEISLTASDVVLPNGLTFENIWPRTVRVNIKADQ